MVSAGEKETNASHNGVRAKEGSKNCNHSAHFFVSEISSSEGANNEEDPENPPSRCDDLSKEEIVDKEGQEHAANCTSNSESVSHEFWSIDEIGDVC